MTIAASGSLEVQAGQLLLDNAPTITNHGTLTTDASTTLNLSNGGTFEQEPDGTLAFGISGPSTFGVLTDNGTFDLNGSTALPVLQGGDVPPRGTAFAVVEGPHGAGTFASVQNTASAPSTPQHSLSDARYAAQRVAAHRPAGTVCATPAADVAESATVDEVGRCRAISIAMAMPSAEKTAIRIEARDSPAASESAVE